MHEDQMEWWRHHVDSFKDYDPEIEPPTIILTK